MVEFTAKVRISMANGAVIDHTIRMDTGEDNKTLEDFKRASRITELGYLQAMGSVPYAEYSNCMVNGKLTNRIILVPANIAMLEIDIITPEELKHACN